MSAEEWFVPKKPGCDGCRYQGTAIPCEYILMTGHSPKFMGAHIDPEGAGGCELYEDANGVRKNRKRPFVVQAVEPKREERMWQLWRGGATDGEIMQECRCSERSVRRWRRRRGLKPNSPYGARRSIDYERVRQLYHRGLEDREIAAAVGASRDSIRRWRRENEFPANNKTKNDGGTKK